MLPGPASRANAGIVGDVGTKWQTTAQFMPRRFIDLVMAKRKTDVDGVEYRVARKMGMNDSSRAFGRQDIPLCQRT